jgi:O-antigen/teichoic acid export membrane protein
MSRRSPLKNASISLVGNLVARLLALVFYAVFARVLGPERYGDQALGAAVGTLAIALVEPGLNSLLIRDGARDRALLDLYLAQALAYKLLLLCVVWPGSVAGAALLGVRGTALTGVAFAGGAVLLGALEDLASSALIALERMDLDAGLRIVSRVSSTGLGLLALALAPDFTLVLAAVCAGALVTSAAGAALIRRAGLAIRLAFHLRSMLERLAQGWPLAASGILWLVALRLDQVLASQLGADAGALGNYGAAVRVVEALMIIPSAIGAAFQARLSRAWARNRESCASEVNLALAAMFATTVPVAVGGAMLSGGLTGLIYGPRFVGTAGLLSIQLFALPLVATQFLGTHALVAAGAVRAQALAVATTLVVNVAVNLVLVPRLGIEGASWSALAGGGASAIVFLSCLRKVGVRAHLLSVTWRPLASAAAMALGLHFLARFSPGLAASIAGGGAVYAAVFLALGGFRTLQALREARAEPSPPPTISMPER